MVLEPENFSPYLFVSAARHVQSPMRSPLLTPGAHQDFSLSVVFYCAALLFIKLAFLFQYYRVLAVQHMRVVYIASIVVVGGWALSQVVVAAMVCNPATGFWGSTTPAKGCVPGTPQVYINAMGNIITDVIVFALPLPAIWSLQLPRPSKILLLAIFSPGFLSVSPFDSPPLHRSVESPN